MRQTQLQPFLRAFARFFQRLIARHFAALLTLLIGVFLPFWVFGELAEEVWEQEGGFAWDDPILLAIRETYNPALTSLAIGLTKLGVFWGVFPAATVVGIILLLRRHWYRLVYLITVLLGSIAINRTAKELLHRVRPHLWVSPAPEFDYGFPSGHAMSSMTFVVALAVVSWHTRWRWWVLLGGSVFVLAIGWTRLYLGVHYPSDILAGWLVSIAWCIGANLVLKPLRQKGEGSRQH